MRRARLAAAALLLAAGAAAADVAPEAARKTVADFLNAAREARTAEGLAAETRRARVEAAIGGAFALDAWERATLGDATLDGEARERFRTLLPAFLARLYLERLPAEGATEITGARPLRADALVGTVIPREEGGGVEVEYRVREVEGTPRIVDVLLGGVSYALTLREGFGDILAEKGPEGLFSYLRGDGG